MNAHRRRERLGSERRQGARHRPHAMSDSAVEAKQFGAAISQVNRIQIAGQEAVAASALVLVVVDCRFSVVGPVVVLATASVLSRLIE